jgi:hypothetical protein
MLIKGSIDMGMPVIVHITYSGSQHYFVLYGYQNEGFEKSDFLTCEPANKDRLNMGEYHISGGHYEGNVLDKLIIYTPK